MSDRTNGFSLSERASSSTTIYYYLRTLSLHHFSYEPEIHPAVTYRMPEFKATFKIFSTGSVTLTCPVLARIPEAIKKIYPMVLDFFK